MSPFSIRSLPNFCWLFVDFFFFGLCLLVFSFALNFWWMGSHLWFLFIWFFFLCYPWICFPTRKGVLNLTKKGKWKGHASNTCPFCVKRSIKQWTSTFNNVLLQIINISIAIILSEFKEKNKIFIHGQIRSKKYRKMFLKNYFHI